MPTVREALLVVIGLAAIAFVAAWTRDLLRARSAGATDMKPPTLAEIVIGFVTNFFDTLGIGSFAPTTAAFKALKLVPDENIPGTMLVGHSLPIVAQAFIFIAVVSVDPTVMLTLIGATVAGGWVGAGVSTRWLAFSMRARRSAGQINMPDRLSCRSSAGATRHG